MSIDNNVTHRDGYIIAKSLFYAAHFIDGLPTEYRAVVDRDDMIRILRARLGERFMDVAERHGAELQEATGRPFNVEDY